MEMFIKFRRILQFTIFVLMGWIIYSPMTSNYLTNPDGISLGVFSKPWSEGDDFGRIGIKYLDIFLGRIISPNLSLIVSLSILGLAIVLLAEILEIYDYKKNILMGSILLLVPNTSSLFTYYYCMIQYGIAFLLGVISCWFLYKVKSRWSWLVGAILITFQLTLYQAYLSVTVLVDIFIIIGACIRGDEIKDIIDKSIKLLLACIFGVMGYLVLLKLLNVSLTSHRGFDQMGALRISELPKMFRNAYVNFYDYFYGNCLLNNTWMLRRYINAVVILAALILLLILLTKRLLKKICNCVIIIILMVLLPIACEITAIIAPGVDPYGTTGILLVPAMSMIYMIPIWFASELCKEIDDEKQCIFKQRNKIWKAISKYGYLVVLVPLLWNLILYTTVVENVMQLNYQSTYALCEKISNSIDVKYGYEQGQKIMIVGDSELGNYPCTYENLRTIVKGSLAEKGYVWKGGWLSNVCYQAIYLNYFGIEYKIPTVDEYNSIISQEICQSMDVFPNENSVEFIDGIVVVKLSK